MASSDQKVFKNIFTTEYRNQNLQNQYDKEIWTVKRHNSLLFLLFFQMIILPMIFFNSIILQNYRFTSFLCALWLIQLFLFSISRCKTAWIEAILFVQILICELSYILGSKSKYKTIQSNEDEVQFLNGFTLGIVLLANQYIQTHSILKIVNNLITVIILFIENSVALYIRISLLCAIIFISIAIHFKDKQMKIRFFNHFKESQKLKGWQAFISEELPQSVFIVTKKENNENADQLQEQPTINLRHKNSSAFTHIGSPKSRIKKESSIFKRNCQDETKNNRNISFLQTTQIPDEAATVASTALPYDIVFMNKKCKSFLSGKKKSENQISQKSFQDVNLIEKQNQYNNSLSSHVLMEMKLILQKLFVQRNIEQSITKQIQQQKKVEKLISPLKNIQKKRSGYFLATEKERISIHKLIQQCLGCMTENILSEKQLILDSNSNERLPQTQHDTNIDLLGTKDTSRNLFAPRIIEHLVNCQHYLQNTYFDLKIFECNYNDKSSLMIIIDDISQKMLEERQRDVETYKEKLLSMITHNLKTPLNGIQCILESIDLEEKEIIVDSATINIALQNTKLLSFMINDLIDYSCIIKEDLILNPKYFKIQDCIKILLPIFQEQLKYKQIDLLVEIDRNIENMHIYNDEQRLLQILVNLISNSLKYTFRGNIKLTIQERNDYEIIFIEVSDTGIGMRESTIKKLNTSNEDIYSKQNYQKGMGLGLQLISNLVSKIGPTQTLQIETSNSDCGTTISFNLYKDIMRKKSLYSLQYISMDQNNSIKQKNFKLDIQKSDEVFLTGNEFKSQELKEEVRHLQINEQQKYQQNQLPVSSTQSIEYLKEKPPKNPKQMLCSLLKNKKVMIVDDTVFNILALKVLLKNIPHLQISEACNGQIAVNMFKQSIESSRINCSDNSFIPDIIFMDINMPIMDGLQATKEITKLAKFYSIAVKIITVSAFSQEQDKENFLIAGSHFHVAKPIKLDLLIEALKSIQIQ